MTGKELKIKVIQGNNVSIVEIDGNERYLKPREALQLSITTFLSNGRGGAFKSIAKVFITNTQKNAAHTLNVNKSYEEDNYIQNESNDVSNQLEPFNMLKTYEYKCFVANGYSIGYTNISA